MDVHATLVRTLEIIEQNKLQQPTLESIAAAVYCSASHLRRLFRLAIGQPLMDYARGRKLAHSTHALLDTDMRIADIAAEYGFAHEQSYIRAFSREFGRTPGRAREEKLILPIRRRIAPEELRGIGSGVLFGPEMVMVPALRGIGKLLAFPHFSVETDSLAVAQIAKEFFFEERLRIKGALTREVYTALCIRHTPDICNLQYFPFIQVKDLSPVPEGLTALTVPSCQAARFRYTGHHSYLAMNRLVSHEMYVARDLFFAEQARYQPRTPIFQLERIDGRLYDGEYSQMELVCYVTDTFKED